MVPDNSAEVMKKKKRGAERREIEKEAELDSFSFSVCGAELHLDFSETKTIKIFFVHLRWLFTLFVVKEELPREKWSFLWR